MRTIRITTFALTAVMLAAIGWSITTGDFADEGSAILDLAWGRMTLIDLYVGIALVFGWVVLREEKPWVSFLWLPVFIVLGNAGTALYAFIASMGADDVRHFLLGVRA